MFPALHLDHNAPWKQRFRLETRFGWKVARNNPAHGLVTSDKTGISQLYAWHPTTGETRLLTQRSAGAWFGVLSPDGRYVYYLEDQQGNEIGHLVRIPYEGGEVEDLTPDLPPYAVPFESDEFGLSISQNANMLGFTIADDKGFHLFCAELDADGHIGPRRKLYETDKLVIGPKLSTRGDLLSLDSTADGDGLQYSILAFGATNGHQFAQLHDPGYSVQTIMFSPLPGDSHLLAISNQTGFNRPLIWNPRTGKRRDILLPELAGEIYPWDWSSDGRCLLLQQFYQAVPQLYTYDLENQVLKRLQHPSYGYISTSFFGPGGEIIVNGDTSTHPPKLVALDPETGQEKRILVPAQETPAGRPFTSVTFPSSDGQMIQAWLGVPEGEGPFPTILETHGGPDAVATSGFWPSGQMWLDHGFAYMTVNYRGSTSFGKAFQEQIWGDVGHWEVEDMVGARNWLVKQGIAHPEQIFLTGWSYGGYLTLHALSIYPHLWAGGMAGIAVTDCAMSYEDEADTLKAYDVTLFKGTPEEKPDLYRRASPITYAEEVIAPILIIQGRNDTRCPPRQVEVYEARMKELSKDIEVHWFDAGHVNAGVEQRIADQERMLRFAYRVLPLLC